MIGNLWMWLYLGHTDTIAVDQGSGYISRKMRENVATARIELREAPINTAGSIGMVERYKASTRKAYDRIRTALDRSTIEDGFLKLAVFYVNTSVGRKRIFPILLV